MTNKTTKDSAASAKHWIADVDGNKAFVEPDEEANWTYRGWTTAADPTGQDRVWLQNADHGGKQLFAASAVDAWAGLGWHPSSPPEPVDLTKDPQLVDEPETKNPKPTKAASGSTKEQ